MDINQAFTFLNFISNKNQSGSVSPSQFNQIADRAQMEFFEKDFRHWQQSQEVTDALGVFLKKLSTSVPLTGKLVYPSDYIHFASSRHYYAQIGKEVQVENVENSEYGVRVDSEVTPPSLRFPILTEYDTYMQVEPKDIGLISLDYFRQPSSPVWGYTTVNNRPIYNAATSVNWELPNETHNALVMMMCSYLGMNIREGELIQYSEMQKQQQ